VAPGDADGGGLGVLAFCSNFIPYVGNLLTVGLVAAVAIVTYDTLWQALLPPLAVIVISGLESNVLHARSLWGGGSSSTRCPAHHAGVLDLALGRAGGDPGGARSSWW
jgi:uncharacterized membrane protein YqaE (UPF0057 family)